MTVALVIPTLNEYETIAAVIAEIPSDIIAQSIVADSGSQDGTSSIAAVAVAAAAAAAAAAGATVVALGERDYGRACATAAAAAAPSCTITVFMDGTSSVPLHDDGPTTRRGKYEVAETARAAAGEPR